MKSGMSLSPITSALLGVTSAYLQSPNAVELGRTSSCSCVTWILPCLAEVGSEHPFPSHCHILSPQEGFCLGRDTSHQPPAPPFISLGMGWLESGETEADVKPHVSDFGSWHFLPHFNTEIWGQDSVVGFFELSPVFQWSSLWRELEPVSEHSSCGEFEAAI